MDKKKRIVLTVDDVVTNLMIVSNILSRDFDVRVAKSGEIALSILDKLSVDLILLDIEMPGMSGFDFLAILKDKPEFSQIPVICVTSHANAVMMDEALRAGARDVIVKPVDPESLTEKVLHVLSL